MIDLLSYQTIRLLNIAEYLITKSSSCSIDTLQELNQCSRKTVYDDLRLLQERWDWVLDLEVYQNHVTTHERSISKLIQFKQNLYHQELKINILKNIFCYPYTTVLDLTFHLNYSESAIRKNIREINKYLKQIDLEIAHNDYRYFLTGKSEHTVRFFVKELLNVSGFYDEIVHFSVEELNTFDQFVQKNELVFTENLKKEALSLYFCILTREKQGFKDPYLMESSKQLQQDIHNYHHLIEVPINHFLNDNKLKITQYDYDLLTNILMMIGFSAKALPYHMDLYINRYQYFLNSFHQQNPSFTSSYLKYIQKLDVNTNIEFSRYSAEMLFHLYTHIETRRYRVLKIGVYSDLGKQHANSILLSISKHFSGQKIELYDSNSQYDLIVCTDISEEFTVPFVTVSDFLTEEDFKNIYKAIFIDNNEFLHQRKLI